MTSDELDAALQRGAWVAPAKAPNPARPLAESLGCSDEHAAAMARLWGLIGEDGMLHCSRCKMVTDWHVGLQCEPCREGAPARKREQERQERERAAMQKREQEHSSPVQRVAGRSFRDGY